MGHMVLLLDLHQPVPQYFLRCLGVWKLALSDGLSLHHGCQMMCFFLGFFCAVLSVLQESLLALNKLREEADLEKGRARWDERDHEKDLEVCIRAKNNAWVIARITRGKELYMVLEKANETLLYASDAVEKFSNRYHIRILEKFLMNLSSSLKNWSRV